MSTEHTHEFTPPAVSRLLAGVNSVYHSLDGFGGILRCEQCGTTKPLGEPSKKLRHGWPKHCGYTMRWWTQRQIDTGEMTP